MAGKGYTVEDQIMAQMNAKGSEAAGQVSSAITKAIGQLTELDATHAGLAQAAFIPARSAVDTEVQKLQSSLASMGSAVSRAGTFIADKDDQSSQPVKATETTTTGITSGLMMT